MTVLQANQTKLEFIKCDLCGSDDYRPIKEIGGWHIVGCRHCGFCYLNPRPAEVEHVYEEVDEARWHRRESQDSRPRQVFFASQLKAIEKALGRSTETRKILDFGCGTGQFLDVARERGWETHGLEPDPFAITIEERGHNAHIGQFPGVELPKDFFDAIFCSAVFEHLPNPAIQLRALREILKPGGILIITSVPSFGSATIRLNIANFYAQSPPGDVNFFTPKSMARMVDSTGFSVLKATSYGFDYNSFLKRRKTTSTTSDSSEKPQKATRGLSTTLPTGLLKLGVALYQQIGFFGLGSKIYLMAKRPG